MLDRLLHRSKTSRGALAVVTGAGSGIGAAFALELGKRGGTVVCSDIDQAAAQRTADTITEHGAKALATRCDVSQFGDVQAL
ncbi:SDR family NAD(P)-dependent oxidoreductase, partial [Mycobacterium avium]